MTTTRQYPRGLAPEATLPRFLAAGVLRAASRLLARLARRLRATRQPRGEPVYEFYAEAGAAEGALYVDGKFVAVLPGVTRL